MAMFNSYLKLPEGTTCAGSSVCLDRQDARVLWRPGDFHLLWSRGTGRGYPSAMTENHIKIHYILGETDTLWKQWFHKLKEIRSAKEGGSTKCNPEFIQVTFAILSIWVSKLQYCSVFENWNRTPLSLMVKSQVFRLKLSFEWIHRLL
jgi:hypothetical protein